MKLEKAERDAGLLPPLKARFLAEPDWIKRGEIVKNSSFGDMISLLGYASRDLWKSPSIGNLGDLLQQYSSSVRGLIETIADEEMFGLDDETAQNRERFYETASRLQPLFDSWLLSLREPAKAVQATPDKHTGE